MFRVKVADLMLQSNTQAKGKLPSDFVELTLPGKIYASAKKVTPVKRASANCETPLAAATADFSAEKADDAD